MKNPFVRFKKTVGSLCSSLSSARILANSPNKPEGLELLNLLLLEGTVLVGKLLLQTLSMNPTTQLTKCGIETWYVAMLEGKQYFKGQAMRELEQFKRIFFFFYNENNTYSMSLFVTQ